MSILNTQAKPVAAIGPPGNDLGFVWYDTDWMGQTTISHNHEACAVHRGCEAFVYTLVGMKLLAARHAAGLETPFADDVCLGERLATYSNGSVVRKAALIGHRVAVGELMIREGSVPFLTAGEFLANMEGRYA